MGYKSQEALRYCYKFLKNHAEQMFLLDVLQEIDKYSTQGGILVQVGMGKDLSNVVHVIPVLSLIVQDNQGAHKCLGVYTSTGGMRPCRFCTVPLSRLQQPGGHADDRKARDTFGVTKRAALASVRSLLEKNFRTRKTIEDNKAIARCQSYSLQHSLCNAVQEVYTFHPLFKRQHTYMFYRCPPDGMHTLLGGLMKSWIFFTATIVEEVSRRDSRTYGDNVVTLDERLKNFPCHCIPEVLRKFTFHKGLSGLLEACKGSSENHTTSSLGGLSQQKYPHLILQIFLTIGIKGDILPNESSWTKKFLKNADNIEFSICETVLTTALVLLDLYFILRKPYFSEANLSQLADTVCNVQFHMLRLWSVKQFVHNTRKKYSGIKLHILSHLPQCIAYFGPPYVFDMVKFDHLHVKYAKNRFKETGGRHINLGIQMIKKVNYITLRTYNRI